MSTPTIPQIECTKHHPSLPVEDVVSAVEFYTKKLGFRLGFMWGDPPEMASVNPGEVQVFLERGTPNPEGLLNLLRGRRCGRVV